MVDLKVWSISTLSLASKQCLGELCLGNVKFQFECQNTPYIILAEKNRKNQNPKEVKLRHNNFPDLKLKLSQD